MGGTGKARTFFHGDYVSTIMGSSVPQSVLDSGLTSGVGSSESSSADTLSDFAYRGSAILPSVSHQGERRVEGGGGSSLSSVA